jgi:hypothetical protein
MITEHIWDPMRARRATALVQNELAEESVSEREDDKKTVSLGSKMTSKWASYCVGGFASKHCLTQAKRTRVREYELTINKAGSAPVALRTDFAIWCPLKVEWREG